MFDALKILERADELLGNPPGTLLNCGGVLLGAEWFPEEVHGPPDSINVVVSFAEAMPSVAVLMALGRAVQESHPTATIRFSHVDAQTLAHLIQNTLVFSPSLLLSLPIITAREVERPMPLKGAA